MSAKASMLGQQGSVELPAPVFEERFHGALVHEAVRAELAARRRGTASTKTRGQVRGGGEKPWRQKGTGRARAGSIRSPIWAGGGTAFGPSPRSFTVKVNRKARRRALRAALSAHAERASIAVVDPAPYAEPSTRQAAEALAKWGAERPVLVVLAGDEAGCAKSFRNIERVAVRPADNVGVADIVWAASLVVSRSALDALAERARPEGAVTASGRED